MHPKGETEEALNVALAIKDKMPPKPPEEPTRKTQSHIDDIQIKIDKKQEEIDNVKKWVRGIAVSGMGLSGALLGARIKRPKESAVAGAAAGIKMGDTAGDIAEKWLNLEVGKLEKRKRELEKKLDENKKK
jgi:hypothetical protein